jgi:hypothetical protein
MSKTLALAAGLMLAGTAAFAHSNEARLDDQAAMIEAGRRNGAITWSEGLRLRKEQAGIVRVKEVLAADGRLSHDDKRVLSRMQDEAEAHIVKESADRWHRLWWVPRFAR